MSELFHQSVSAYFAAVSALDTDAFVATFAETARHFDPANGPELQGHDQIRQFFQAISAGFESVSMQADHVFVVGCEAAVKWSASGRGKNGRAVAFEGIDLFEFDETGKIQKIFGYWDPAALLQELQA